MGAGSGDSEHTHSHTHNTNVTVTENRAPTDESVKLLNEMQKKAFENIVASYHTDNELKSDFHVCKNDFSQSHTVKGYLFINSKKLEVERMFYDWETDDIDKFIHIFKDWVVEEISKFFGVEFFSKNVKLFRPIRKYS